MPRLEQLLTMLQAEPADSFVRYAVAMEYLKAKRYAEAIGEFDELLRRNPDYVAAYFMGGRARQQQGDVPGAKATYAQGVEVAKKVGDQKAAREIADALALLG